MRAQVNAGAGSDQRIQAQALISRKRRKVKRVICLSVATIARLRVALEKLQNRCGEIRTVSSSKKTQSKWAGGEAVKLC
jgi:hypothetical protein